jgi:hypothetical protein
MEVSVITTIKKSNASSDHPRNPAKTAASGRPGAGEAVLSMRAKTLPADL